MVKPSECSLLRLKPRRPSCDEPRVCWGLNEVIAAVYGPMEAHPARYNVKIEQFLTYVTTWRCSVLRIESDRVLIEEVER